MHNRRSGRLASRGRIATLFAATLLLASPGCSAPAETDAEESFESALEGAEITMSGSITTFRVDTFDFDSPDDPNNPKAWAEYILTTDRGEQVHAVTSDRKEHHSMAPQTRVRIRGRRRGNTLVVSSEDVGAMQTQDGSGQAHDHGAMAVSGALTAGATGPRKMLVLLVNFAGEGTRPVSLARVKSRLFDETLSTNAYYLEQSFGKVGFTGKINPTGDVYGWYTIDAPDHATKCNWPGWASMAKAAAKAAGVDPGGYDHTMYVIGGTINSCPWVGIGEVGGKQTFVRATEFPASSHAANHELGHNLGLHHAHSYRCVNGNARVAIGGSCTDAEYGDPFDAMGSGRGHFNAYSKARLGWIPEGNSTTLTAGGEFSLLPQEWSASGLQVIRIPRTKSADNSFYYLEFRRPHGFDDFPPNSRVATGVSIRIGPDTTVFNHTKLIDTVPSTETFNDAALAAGQTFSDPLNGIEVTTLAVSATEARVRVNLTGSPPPPPTPPTPTTPTTPTPTTTTTTTTPTTTPPTLPNDGIGTGLRGDYFDDPNFTVLKLTRTDPGVNFIWGKFSPDSSIAPNTFSVRWTGQVQPAYSETYTFSTRADDGVRLWVDGQLLIDDWTVHLLAEKSGTIELAAGQKYDIKMEYFDDLGPAVATLLWSSPSQAKEVVPTASLFPSP